MAATRTLWSGSLVLGALTVPVKIIGSGDSPTKIAFNHAHHCKDGTFTRIQQKRRCPTCEKDLSNKEIARVFEHTPGQYLEVTDAELATCEPTASPLLTITSVLPEGIPLLYVEEAALLIPDGAPIPFYTFLRALHAGVAEGELVLQKRGRRVAITRYAHAGLVYLLRTTEEVRALEQHLPAAEERPALQRASVDALHEQLVTLPHTFEPVVDTYNAAVRRLLIKKIETQSKTELTAALHASKRTSKRGKR